MSEEQNAIRGGSSRSGVAFPGESWFSGWAAIKDNALRVNIIVIIFLRSSFLLVFVCATHSVTCSEHWAKDAVWPGWSASLTAVFAQSDRSGIRRSEAEAKGEGRRPVPRVMPYTSLLTTYMSLTESRGRELHRFPQCICSLKPIFCNHEHKQLLKNQRNLGVCCETLAGLQRQ